MSKSSTLPVVPIDKELKKKLYQSCKTLGISYSTLITLFVKKWLIGEVSLKISHIDETDYLLSTEENKKHLLASLKEEKENKIKEISSKDLQKML